SENGAFVRRCEQAGIRFIGPKADVMEQMGDKIQARNVMEKAGVPVIPGTKEGVKEETAKQKAGEIGYPIMLKASAGGGGIGMQVENYDEELEKVISMKADRGEQLF